MRVQPGWLFVLAILFTPFTAHAAGECTPLKDFQTQINVNLTVSEPYYDTSLSAAAMAKAHRTDVADWLKKNNMQALWSADDMTTDGLASSGFSTMTRASFIAKPFEKHYGVHYCPYFETINVDLFYRTLIQIPHDFLAHPCEYNLVNTHELKHDKVYREAIQIYADRLRADMRPIVQDLEADYEVRTTLSKRENRMIEGVQDALQVYFGDIASERMNRLNALVDSPQEYATGSAMMDACRMKEQ